MATSRPVYLGLFLFLTLILFSSTCHFAVGGTNEITLMGQTATGSGKGGNQSSITNHQSVLTGNGQNSNQQHQATVGFQNSGVNGGNSAQFQLQQLDQNRVGMVIRVGDKLYVIANLLYQTPYGWRNIYYENQQKIGNPNRSMASGSVLLIPGVPSNELQTLINASTQNQSSSGTQGYNNQQQSYSSNQQQSTLFPTTTVSVRGNKPLFTGSSNYGATPGFNWSSQIRTNYTRVNPQRSGSRSSDRRTSHIRSSSSYQNSSNQHQQHSSSNRFNLVSPITVGNVTSDYGHRSLRGKANFHGGIDVGAPAGTPIRSTGDGVVVASQWMRGYGNCVKVKHADGTITFYAHCKRLNVRSGQRVRAGQQVATVNSTGNSTGNHLHYEIKKDGKSIDPRKYFNFPRKGGRVTSSNIVPR